MTRRTNRTRAVSVGVCAYKEERNIGSLLHSIISQKTSEFHIKEIIVVLSGPDDATEKICRGFAQLDKRICLIKERERKGKYTAVNKILKCASSDIIVLVSADVIAEQYAVERLCEPLKENMVGITTSRPVPLNKGNSFWGYVAFLIWDIHHEISLKTPKFTEMIAFRALIDKIPPTAVDDEEIASIILSTGYGARYVPDAIVFNRAPENFHDYLMQRRRIYGGHLDLARRRSHLPLTANNLALTRIFFRRLMKEPLHLFIAAALMEVLVRVIATLDYIRGKRFYVWERVESAGSKN